MSGYAGNNELEAEHAIILSENAINAAQSMLIGSVRSHCLDCGMAIPLARQEAARKLGHRCFYCISCQEHHDQPARHRMLDRIL